MFLYPRTAIRGSSVGEADIAIRMPQLGDRPEEIIMIYIVAGEAQVATTNRVYGASTSWRHEFNLGPAISVAIEFDHIWTPMPNGKFRPITVGDPFYFWVEPLTSTTGRLQCTQDPNVNPKVLVPSGVSKISALRGWKNVRRSQEDQGIVVGYIKNGEAYYMNYADDGTGNYFWSDEIKINGLPSNLKNIKLFRTNDYRIGFVVETLNKEIYWALSERNFAGIGATKPEMLPIPEIIPPIIQFFKPNVVNAYHGVEDRNKITSNINNLSALLGYAGTNNQMLSAYNEDAFTIILTTLNPFYNIDITDFRVTDSNNRGFKVVSIENLSPEISIGNNKYRLVMEDFNNAIGDLTISFTSTGTTSNIVGGKYPAMQISFTPVGLTPIIIDPPKVVSIYNAELSE